jgi:hypothetical protein
VVGPGPYSQNPHFSSHCNAKFADSPRYTFESQHKHLQLGVRLGAITRPAASGIRQRGTTELLSSLFMFGTQLHFWPPLKALWKIDGGTLRPRYRTLQRGVHSFVKIALSLNSARDF